MPDVFDQIHAESAANPPVGGGDVFDQIHAGAAAPPNAPAKPASVGEQFKQAAAGFAKEGLSNLNPMKAISGIGSMIQHPIDTLFTPGMKADREQAGKDLAAGHYFDAFSNGLNGTVPIVGPINSAEHKAAESRDPEAMGRSLADLVSLKAVPKIYGAMIPAVGKMAGAPAGPIAETALGIKKLDRAYGKTPGQAILDETQGVRPSTVANNAESQLGDINHELESTVMASRGPASLKPALNVIYDARNKAQMRNSAGTVNQLAPMESHLTVNATNGLPLSPIQHPMGLLNLKRGFGDEFVHNWNPETMAGVKSTAAKAYRALDDELDRTVPEAANLNQRASSLIPVAKRAASTDLDANALQRVMGRFARPTGALASAITGAYEGGRHFGPVGAIGGGLVGAGLPELLSDPTAQMIVARSLDAIKKGTNSAVGKMTARQLGRAAIITPRKNQEEEE